MPWKEVKFAQNWNVYN